MSVGFGWGQRMAKRRQHYVPRFLLNRFASRVEGDRRFVWQFARERPPLEVSTRDVGVASNFYGSSATGLEDSLATAESDHAKVLRRIDQGDSPEIYAEQLRDLMWTLSVRTRAMRHRLAEFGNIALKALASTLDSESAERAIKQEASRQFDDRLEAWLLGLPSRYRERATELLADRRRRLALKQRLLGELEAANLANGMATALSIAAGMADFSDAAAKGQIRGVTGILEKRASPARFAPAHWAVIRKPAGTYILGDACVFARDADGKLGNLITIGAAWKRAYLPISDSAMLVASMSASEADLTDDQINSASVEHSWDSFFASQHTQVEVERSSRIRAGEPLLSINEIMDMARDAWKGLSLDSDSSLPD